MTMIRMKDPQVSFTRMFHSLRIVPFVRSRWSLQGSFLVDTTSISFVSFSLSRAEAKIAQCVGRRSSTQVQETPGEEGLSRDSASKKESGKEEPRKPEGSSSASPLAKILNLK